MAGQQQDEARTATATTMRLAATAPPMIHSVV